MKTVSRRGIAKSSPGGPHPAAHLSTRHPGRSNVAISLPCYMPPIYVSTTPGRYLQPANKLIHYSTEQSSSLLCLGSFTSLLGSRSPTASLFLRDFSGNFARDSVKPLSRSVAETMIRRDLLVVTTAESAAPQQLSNGTIDRSSFQSSTTDYSETRYKTRCNLPILLM